MSKIKIIAATALFVIIVALVATLTGTLLADAWAKQDREFIRSLVGAFAGAFFAFLFVRLGEGLKRLFERQEKHDTTLVRLQHYFNDCLNITNDNLFVSNDFLGTFTDKVLDTKEARIFINRFQPYPIESDLLLGLSNIDFLNDVYTLNIVLRKLNDSMSAIDRSYEQMMNAFISKKLDMLSYIENVRSLRNKYVEINGFLNKTTGDIIHLFATSRLLNRDAPWFVHVLRFLTTTNYNQRLKKSLPGEIQKLESEIEESTKKSQQRIAEASDLKEKT